MFWSTDILCGIRLLRRHTQRPIDGERVMRLDEIAQFWAKKRDENQHILDLIDAGTLIVGDRSVLDAETIAEVRIWAVQRVAECAARIAERHAYS